jgi:hypothetical protein
MIHRHIVRTSYRHHFRTMFGLPLLISLFILIIQSAFIVFFGGGLPIGSSRTPFDSLHALGHFEFVSRDSRKIGSPHYQATFDYIVQNLNDSGLQVYSQSRQRPFLAKPLIHQRRRTMRNIVAFRNGSDPTLDWLVLSTHFDSDTNNAGANDVAVMLELAHSVRSNATLVFVFLGAKDGAKLMAPHLNGSVISLAAMGTGQLLAVRASTGASDSLLGALERVPGAAVGNFIRGFYSAPGCSSMVDLDVYTDAGLSGVGLVHIGEPTKGDAALHPGATRMDLMSAGRMLAMAITNYPAKKLLPVMQQFVSIGFTILGLLHGGRRIKNWVAFVIAVVTIGLVCAAFVGVAALLHLCNSVTFAAFPGLWFVVLTAVGCVLARVGHLPLGTAEPIRVFLFTLLLLGTRQSSIGLAMFLFLALSIPICWPNPQPGDELPSQPKPEAEMGDDEKGNATERPSNKPKKAANKKFSRGICGFIDLMMTWSVSILIILLQVIPFCYCLCLVYRISVSSVSQSPSFLGNLASMLIIALNSIFIFLYSGQFRTPESHDRREPPFRWMRSVWHFVPFLVVAVLLAVIPRLWLPDSAIVGVKSCFIYENGTSVTSFVPLGGTEVIKSIERRRPIKLVHDWQGYLLPRGPALVINESFKDHRRFMPQFKRRHKNVTFKSGPIPEGTTSVALIVKCQKRKCVRALGNLKQIAPKRAEFGNFTAIFRVSPVDRNLSMTFLINERRVPIDVLYISNEMTPGLSQLRTIMGGNVRGCATEEFLSGTVRIFHRDV